MLQTCPACNSDNRDVAKFCDQCGAPLSPESEVILAARLGPTAAAATPVVRTGGGFNWAALLSLVAIALAILYFIRPNEGAAPKGGPAAGDNPAAMMEEVQKQLDGLKKKLDKDPMDIEALNELYSMYEQIGQTEKVKPFVNKAIEAWKKKYPEPTEEDKKILASIALAALNVNELEPAAEVLKVYHEAEPENLGIVATLGNIYYELQREEDAIEWYGKYLEKATPEKQGGDYWNILVDQASMYLHKSNGDATSPSFNEAMTRLQRATKSVPKHWAAWFNLGETYKAADDEAKALSAYKMSEEVADDGDRRWQSQSKIAELEGKPAPLKPQTDPHAGIDMGGGSGFPKPPPGTPNPHAGEGGLPTTPPADGS